MLSHPSHTATSDATLLDVPHAGIEHSGSGQFNRDHPSAPRPRPRPGPRRSRGRPPNNRNSEFYSRVSRPSASGGIIGEYRDASYWMKLVLSLSVSKLFVEASLRCAQFLQVAVTSTLSFRGQFVVYGIESATFCFIPMLYRWFEVHTQAKYLLFIGGCGPVIYVYYMAGSSDPPYQSVGDVISNIIAFAVDGLVYPLSTVGAVSLVARAAYFRLHDPTLKDDNLNNNNNNNRHSRFLSMWDMGHNGSEGPLGRELARFYGVYFGFYAGSGILCLLLGILLLQLPHHMGLGEYKGLTFWALGMVGLMGAFSYLSIPPSPRSDVIPGSPTPCVSPWKTLIFAITHRTFTPYALLLILCGMLEAYGYVDFVMYISAPRIGPRSTSLVTGFALLVDGCIALMYGYLVYRGVCRLRTVLLLGAVALVVAMAYCATLSLLILLHPTTDSYPNSPIGINYIRVPGDIEDWTKVDDVEVYDYFIVIFGIILIGLGLVPYKVHILSVTQRIYQATPYYLQVSTHYKGLRSVGFIIQLGIDTFVSSYYGISHTSNIIAALIILVLSILSYIPLGYRWLKIGE